MKTLLVIVDMINGFITQGALSDPNINTITPNILEGVNYCITNDQPILAFRDSHDEHANEFKSFPVHCLANSYESELIDELKPYETSFKTLLKNSTNGFVQPEFLDYFNSINPDKVIITGCCTDICVLQFTLGLKGYINQYNLPIELYVPKDSVATFDSPVHNAKEMDEISFNLLAAAGVNVVDTYQW
ncbi:MAG: cysteine hydrolase [Erysipelotrichaceae bacterium]|nr:cysteine hydrolase [Erysipelotrichaceae bacterium]